MLKFQTYKAIWETKMPFTKLYVTVVSVLVEVGVASVMPVLDQTYCKMNLLIHSHECFMFGLKTNTENRI